MSHCDTPIVYILDAEASLRDTLRRLMESVGLHAQAFSEINAFLTAYQPDRPGCLLLDIQISECATSSAQQLFRKHDIDLPVIVTAPRGDVATAVTAMKWGAMDFLEKPLNEQWLLDGVHHAVTEDRNRRRTRAWRRMLQDRFKTLTPREQNILQQVVDGLSNREIAERLDLSRKTVEVHRARVMQKMEARTLSQLIQMALALGILKLYDRDQ
ncbi:MAG: response regulator transcription factor [Candidatus Competibacteraceae bacterium]|nr:response regulator transcription factor [Candidatus Competibacteraceae bacterium]